MNDSAEETVASSDQQPAKPASVGGLLAAAREKAGMSIEAAASQLRLSVRQVQALEADDASALPAPTFVRGFIRNYAKLLALDVDALLEVYRVYAPSPAQGAISLHSENIPILNHDKRAWLPYAMASAIVAVALGGWMVYMEYAVETKTIAPIAKVEKTVVAPKAPADRSESATVPSPSAVPATTAPVPTSMGASPSTAPATSSLSMTFTGQSWVQVTDRDGIMIFNKSQPAGSQVVVEGQPPFSIVIGNASGVQLGYHDKPVDLAPYTKANVARLTLE